jgi:putative adhesin
LNNKLFVVAAVTGLIISLAGSTPADKNEKQAEKPGEKIERSVPVTPEAVITLCVGSGTLTVRGWDKHEVRVRSLDASAVELRRIDKPKDPQSPGAASRIDVMVFDKEKPLKMPGKVARMDCQAVADVDMEVPATATVQVQTRDGDISIAGVAAAYAGSQNSDIMIERVSKLVEAGSVGGSISLKNSSGMISLSSAGGGVDATNIKAASPDDTLEVGTVSGDIQLNGITTSKVTAKTVSGTLMMSGALVKSGYYSFTNMTGDVVLELPRDASFKLSAKVSERQHLVSDFVLKYLSEVPPAPPGARLGAATPKPGTTPNPPGAAGTPKPPAAKGQPVPRTGPVVTPVVVERPNISYALRRIDAICGTGDATISINSFGGTVRLKKL